jgi:hypothetical protein
LSSLTGSARTAAGRCSKETADGSNDVRKSIAIITLLLFDKRAFAILLKSRAKLFLRIHDDGARPRNGLTNGLSRNENKTCPIIFRTYYYLIPLTLEQYYAFRIVRDAS